MEEGEGGEVRLPKKGGCILAAEVGGICGYGPSLLLSIFKS
jgi:hypothetical protein